MSYVERDMFGEAVPLHQSQMPPEANKFHVGNGDDGKHYWCTPWHEPEFVDLVNEFGPFDFDPCPYPKPDDFDGLTAEWKGKRIYLNIPFGSVAHWSASNGCDHVANGRGRKFRCTKCGVRGEKKGPTAWFRKAIAESRKGKRVVIVYPVDKWVLMLLTEILGDHAQVRNLGDVKWLATEDGSQGKGTGRHIACFILGEAA